MKITEKAIAPPPPPPVTYVVEFTFEELVTLGVLSYRHEVRWPGGQGNTFLRRLPSEVREEANRRAGWLNSEELGRRQHRGTAGVTTTSVDWRSEP